MKFKSIITSILLATCVTAFADNPATATKSSARSMHAKAHAELQANVNKNKLDQTVVKEIIKEDVAKRESELIAGLSPESQLLVTDILAEANKHIGKPYRHGMKGPNAFDCSGFTSYVYKQFGYKISPASRMQYNDGVSVDRKNLRKGDLVFFTSPRSGSNVGHVGMVVSADNETGKFKFIHASIKGVKISDIDEAYYTRRYVGARRIITD